VAGANRRAQTTTTTKDPFGQLVQGAGALGGLFTGIGAITG